MQIHLKQTELEVAVRDFINKSGITRPVGDIKFSISRNPTAIITEVAVNDAAIPAGPIARAPEVAASIAPGLVPTAEPTPTAEVGEITEEGEPDPMPEKGASLFGGGS